jgi:ZIP family zinc transporter
MSEIIVSSLIAGLATCLGAVIVILLGKPQEKVLSALLGLAAGIMLAVVVLDLLPSALEQGGFRQVAMGFSIGVIVMLSLDVGLSHFFSPVGSQSSSFFLKMGYLIAAGIALHDLPEGMAIAAGYTAQSNLGLIIALAIGLHNIPEGMATATPLRIGGLAPINIFLLNAVVSLFTPLGALIGLVLVNVSPSCISLMLAIAAGAMTFIVKNEILPQSRHRHPNYSSVGGIIGFLFILGLSFIH